MVINEEEAKWVRWIFEQALSGVASARIAKQLNEKQVPSRRNGNWTPTTIRGMLTKPDTRERIRCKLFWRGSEALILRGFRAWGLVNEC